MELGIHENNVIQMMRIKNDGEMVDVMINVRQRHGVIQIIMDKD